MSNLSSDEKLILRYTTAPEVLTDIKATWGTTSEESQQTVWNRFIRPEVLVLDDVDVQLSSAGDRVLITKLISQRYNALRPTVLAANLTLSELTEVVGERVIDRLRDGGFAIVCDWPSFRRECKQY